MVPGWDIRDHIRLLHRDNDTCKMKVPMRSNTQVVERVWGVGDVCRFGSNRESRESPTKNCSVDLYGQAVRPLFVPHTVCPYSRNLLVLRPLCRRSRPDVVV